MRSVIALRKKHPVLRRRRFFAGRSIRGADVKDIAWFDPNGKEMTDDTWSARARAVPRRAPRRRRHRRDHRARRAHRRRHAAGAAERARRHGALHAAADAGRVALGGGARHGAPAARAPQAARRRPVPARVALARRLPPEPSTAHWSTITPNRQGPAPRRPSLAATPCPSPIVPIASSSRTSARASTGAAYPIKRVPGEPIEVTADVFGDGHDVIRAVLRHRDLDPQPASHARRAGTSAPLTGAAQRRVDARDRRRARGLRSSTRSRRGSIGSRRGGATSTRRRRRGPGRVERTARGRGDGARGGGSRRPAGDGEGRSRRRRRRVTRRRRGAAWLRASAARARRRRAAGRSRARRLRTSTCWT